MLWTSLKLVKEIVETIVAILLLVGWVRATFAYLWEPSRPLIFNLLLLLLSAVGFSFISRLLYRNSKGIRREIRLRKVVNDVKSEAENYKSKDVNELIPKTKTVKEVFDFLHNEAKSWSFDAVWTSANLYVHVGSAGSVDYSYQAFFWSENKSLERHQHFFSSSSKFTEDGYVEQEKPRRKIIPFHEKYKGWRKATVQAVESQIDRSDGRVDISIHQHEADMSINITIYSGKLQHEKKFSFNGRSLKNDETDKELKIKGL